MSIASRCQACGKAHRDGQVPKRCPHCGWQDGLGEASAPEALPSEQTPLTARAVPWMMSVFFHAALVLIMAFVVMVIVKDKSTPPTVMASLYNTDRDDGQMTMTDPAQQSQAKRDQSSDAAQARTETITDPSDPMDRPIVDETIYGVGPVGTPERGEGVTFFHPIPGPGPKGNDPGPGPGPGPGPAGGKLRDVVYVIDRSGSMINKYDNVRQEMIFSVARLNEKQRFNVVLFSDGEPIQLQKGRLVAASRVGKRRLVRFLEPVLANGKTDPVPALEAAFSALKADRDPQGGQAILLLTDASFPDNDAVLECIRKHNADAKVAIFTFLYGDRPPEAVAVMKRIATDNHGQYNYVSGE